MTIVKVEDEDVLPARKRRELESSVGSGPYRSTGTCCGVPALIAAIKTVPLNAVGNNDVRRSILAHLAV